MYYKDDDGILYYVGGCDLFPFSGDGSEFKVFPLKERKQARTRLRCCLFLLDSLDVISVCALVQRFYQLNSKFTKCFLIDCTLRVVFEDILVLRTPPITRPTIIHRYTHLINESSSFFPSIFLITKNNSNSHPLVDM